MSLNLVVEKGKSIYVGGVEVQVTEILASKRFKLCVKQDWADQVFEITNRMKVDIMPQVRVSAGLGTQQVAKLMIDAPRHIVILREELLEND